MVYDKMAAESNDHGNDSHEKSDDAGDDKDSGSQVKAYRMGERVVAV